MSLHLAPALDGLDRLRARLLRALGPLAGRVAADRELRVGLGGAAGMVSALLLTVVAPFCLLALGPIVLGIPHLLADVRYLVIRPGWFRRRELWLACGAPIAAAGLGAGPAVGVAATLGAFAMARAPLRRRLFGGACAAALVLVAAAWPSAFRLVFAHAHNFIAVGLWWAWRPRATRRHHLPLVLFAAGCLVLMSGVLEPMMHSLGALALAPPGMGLQANLGSIAAGVAEPWAVRLVLLYAFAQSVHYAVWLRLIPDEDRERPTPRTFRASARRLELELGSAPLVLLLAACGLLAAWAVIDLVHAREGYFGLALFHGYLELAAAALWIAEGRPGSGSSLRPAPSIRGGAGSEEGPR